MQERDQYLLRVIPTKHGRSNEPAKRVGVGLVFNASTGADAAILADAGIIRRAPACAENYAHQSPESNANCSNTRGRGGLTHASDTRCGSESRFGLNVGGRGEDREEGADGDGCDLEGEHG